MGRKTMTPKALAANKRNAKKAGRKTKEFHATSLSKLEQEVEFTDEQKEAWERIQREINLDQILYWIGLQATQEEIAGAFRMSIQTLNNKLRDACGMNFSELKRSLGGGSEGKLALRRNQFKLSENNASMAIWLGKNWLGQKDQSFDEKSDLEKEAVSLLKKLNEIKEVGQKKYEQVEHRRVSGIAGGEEAPNGVFVQDYRQRLQSDSVPPQLDAEGVDR